MMLLYGYDDLTVPLLRSIREGRGSHAYLVSGSPRVGKSTLARAIAGAVCCPEPEPPCGVCSACRRIAAGTHPDVEVLAPGGICEESEHDHSRDGSRDVRICQVRRAERMLNLAPFEGRARVVIIDPADALNAQSADAFLKTLEEPPAQALIVLVSVEAEALPETLRSRCRQVALRTLPVSAVERVLREQRGAPPEHAALLARLSGGRIGWALAALDDPGFVERRAARLDEVAALSRQGRTERFDYVEKLAGGFARGRDEVYAVLSLWMDWWRDVLLIASGSDTPIVNADRAPELTIAAGRYEPFATARFLRALREARHDLESNVNPRLALESLMLRLPAPVKGDTAV